MHLKNCFKFDWILHNEYKTFLNMQLFRDVGTEQPLYFLILGDVFE